MSLRIKVAGRFALEAAQGDGEVRAVFRRSFYARFANGYVCVGDASLGRGPLNALVDDFTPPAIGERVSLSLEGAIPWSPPPLPQNAGPDVTALRKAARGRVPGEGLGGLVVDEHNALSGHAQPALEAIDRWLVGNALGDEAEPLIGIGPGLTPSGDDYLGGVLIALNQFGRRAQAIGLWRWLHPRLERTSDISAAHLSAAASGEGHETLHRCIDALCTTAPNWPIVLDELDAVGHCSGWDSLAGVVAVAKLS
ncbi:MAG TPA: DUF2877 domain-containing protein [Burkholderiales bacterium]|nr:DUF2877 domain-containing protein [Burkholderiales bacterium]